MSVPEHCENRTGTIDWHRGFVPGGFDYVGRDTCQFKTGVGVVLIETFETFSRAYYCSGKVSEKQEKKKSLCPIKNILYRPCTLFFFWKQVSHQKCFSFSKAENVNLVRCYRLRQNLSSFSKYICPQSAKKLFCDQVFNFCLCVLKKKTVALNPNLKNSNNFENKKLEKVKLFD